MSPPDIRGGRRLFRPLLYSALCALSLLWLPDRTAALAAAPAFLPLTPTAEDPGTGFEPGVGIPPVLPLPGEGAGEQVPASRVPSLESREREMRRRGIVRAEIRPAKPLLLSAPFPGVLASVAVRDGEAVVKGAAIAVFDTEQAAKAVEEARLALAEAIATVQEPDGGPARERERAGTLLAKRADALRDAEEKLARCRLVAPFDGRVTEVRASAGQHLRRGDVVVELAETGDLEIVCTVPSQWISRLKPGHIIWVYVEESGKSYEAEFVRFGGKVDTAGGTIKTYSRFLAPDDDLPPDKAPAGELRPEELLPGMRGRADFFPKRQAGEQTP